MAEFPGIPVGGRGQSLGLRDAVFVIFRRRLVIAAVALPIILIASLGLFKNTGSYVAACQMLLDRHGGQVPRTREALEALPGVGRKTANVVLNVAFGEPTMAVDTHILRLSNRTGLAPGKTPRDVEDALLQRVPSAYLRDAHHWLILHGRYVCQARTPRCWECQVAAQCDFTPKTMLRPHSS